MKGYLTVSLLIGMSLIASCTSNKVVIPKPVCLTLPIPKLPTTAEARIMSLAVRDMLFEYERYYYEHGCYQK